MEIELKFKLNNPQAIENKIKNLGAKFLGKSKEFDIYFDDTNKSLSKQKKVLRLRKCNKGIFLTFKKVPKDDSIEYKKRHELEIELLNFNQALKILHELGFLAVIRRLKLRKTYKYRDSYLLIDKLPKLGYYLEIESSSQAGIDGIMRKLGLDKKHATILSYNELFRKDKAYAN